ncbi:MAG TPA: DUF1398 domain-containing protein [Fibrobacteria bacterium]|nr:DUF1398 domain-containing protein [Fibrobacteria bacterium]
MDTNWKELARTTSEASESGAMDFGQVVKTLMDAGFDGYDVDFRRSTRTAFLPDGRFLVLETSPVPHPVGERFEVDVVREAIREAQTKAPGYTYPGFCAKVVRAGCAGYHVSILGKRVLYYGRTGETHTEYFPGTGPAAAR